MHSYHPLAYIDFWIGPINTFLPPPPPLLRIVEMNIIIVLDGVPFNKDTRMMIITGILHGRKWKSNWHIVPRNDTSDMSWNTRTYHHPTRICYYYCHPICLTVRFVCRRLPLDRSNCPTWESCPDESIVYCGRKSGVYVIFAVHAARK